MNRKEFFKQIGLKLGNVVEEKIDGVYSVIEGNEDLNEQQKKFLTEYGSWLTKFQSFVAERNRNPFDMVNNKQLMLISAEADKRRPALEMYMKNEKFAQVFESITTQITQAISD